MDYTAQDLAEAKRQIDSTVHKLKAVLAALEAKEDPARYKSQITLAQRRIRAFELAGSLIDRELGR